jgi:hypothetical protein
MSFEKASLFYRMEPSWQGTQENFEDLLKLPPEERLRLAN